MAVRISEEIANYERSGIMKKLLTILCVLLALTLAACAPTGPETTDPPTKPTVPAASTSPETTPKTEPTEPPVYREGETGEALTAAELSEFESLFAFGEDPGHHGVNLYHMALCSEYASPEETDVFSLFYNGFRDESQQPTAEEEAFLKDRIDGLDEKDLIRIPGEKMDALLRLYFGVDLAQTRGVGLEKLVYFADTDCYYHAATGLHLKENYLFTDGYCHEDGQIVLYYTDTLLGGEYAVVLMPQNGEAPYRVVSNLKVSG